MKLQRLVLKVGLLLPLLTVAYLGFNFPEPSRHKDPTPVPSTTSPVRCDKPHACVRPHLERTRPGKIVDVDDDNWCSEVISYMKDHPVLVWFPNSEDQNLYKQDCLQMDLLAQAYSGWNFPDYLNMKVVRINPKSLRADSPIRNYFHGKTQDIWLIQGCNWVLDHSRQITRHPCNKDPWQVVGPNCLDSDIHQWIESVHNGTCGCHASYRNRKPSDPPPSVIRQPRGCCLGEP